MSRVARLPCANTLAGTHEESRDLAFCAFDALPIISVLVGPDGSIKLVNEAWWQFARENGLDDFGKIAPGVNYLEECGRAIRRGDKSAMEALRGIEAVILGELREFTLEYPCHSPDESRWYIMKVKPVGEDGNVLISHIEITKRRLAEDALRESKERYRELYDDNPTMYFTVDSQGTVLSVNRFGAEQLGYTPQELVGRPVLTVFHQDDRESVSEQFEDCLKNPMHVAHWEFRKIRKDGRVLWVRETARAFVRGDGKNVLLVVCEDITERKSLERELRSYAQKLERSNRELQEFAFVASHDLREPLRKIQAFSTMLKKQDVSGEPGDLIERMQKATIRMQNLIDGLLDYSRVTSSEKPLRPVNLTEIVKETASDLEVRLRSTGGSVEVQTLPTIEADPSQMQQLFQNLINNALKFHREEKPIIRIYAQLLDQPPIGKESDSGEWYQIFVEDNGIGFDEKDSERIFKLLERLHGRSQYEGAGIGLAVCRKIVERHGGSITATSKRGEGSTFIITLPVKQTGFPL